MPIKFPDILQNNSDLFPLVDITSIKGNAYPINALIDTGSIPGDKRNIGAIVFVTSSREFFGFIGTSSNGWDIPTNWEPLGSGGGSGIFDQTGSFFATTNDLQITGSLIITGSDAVPIQSSGQSINIGTPEDGTYTDGFFTQFTSATSLANAIDAISEAFKTLAPPPANDLNGKNLSISNLKTGLLADGLEPTHWYNHGKVAGSSVSFTINNTFNLSSPSPGDTFLGGTNSDRIAGTLTGGVTSSVLFRQNAPTLTSRALSSGQGPTLPLNITSIAQYNDFWAKINARIEQSLDVNETGSYRYKMLADNGAGETNNKDLWWVGDVASGHYPNQTVTPGTVVTTNDTFKYLSGMTYLKTATFTIPLTAEDMFSPVYEINNVTWQSSPTNKYFNNVDGGTAKGAAPQFNSVLTTTDNLTLKLNINSGRDNPEALITVRKPGKSVVSTPPFEIYNRPVNSYTSPQSTNSTEKFLDEDERVEGWDETEWDSVPPLTSPNLQVQNGILVTGNTGDYSGFSGEQYYYRVFSGLTVAQVGGTFNFQGNFFGMGPWGSTSPLQVIAARPEDISGTAPTVVYDFGRAAGINDTKSIPTTNGGAASVPVKGIFVGTVGPLLGTWSFGTQTDIGNSGKLIILIKYNNANIIQRLTQLFIETAG